MRFFSIGIIEIIEPTLAQFAAEGDDFPILDLLDVVDRVDVLLLGQPGYGDLLLEPDWRSLSVGWSCLGVGSVESRGPDNTIFSLLNNILHHRKRINIFLLLGGFCLTWSGPLWVWPCTGRGRGWQPLCTGQVGPQEYRSNYWPSLYQLGPPSNTNHFSC